MLLELFFQNPLVGIAWLVAIFMALTVHEFSHAYIAYRLGDYTAKDADRLTLNPFKHIDLTGLFLMIVAGFGWAKPVPVNERNLRNQKWGPVAVSLAGPGANLTLVVVVTVILKLLVMNTAINQNNGLFILLYALLIINVTFMIFNLIPIPPLDGSHVLFSFLPDKYENLKINLLRWGPLILIGIVFLGDQWLSLLFQLVTGFFTRLIF